MYETFCPESPTAAKLMVASLNLVRSFTLNSVGKNLWASLAFQPLERINGIAYNPFGGTRGNILISEERSKTICEFDVEARTLKVLLDKKIESVKDMEVGTVGRDWQLIIMR